MHRRDVLRVTAAGLGAGLAGLAGSDPTTAHPGPYEPYGRVPLHGAKEAVVARDGHTVYVALTDGVGVVDIADPATPTVLAEHRDLFADRETGPLQAIYDVQTDADRLVVAGPAHGLSGTEDHLMGAAVYDVGDPSAPELLALHETDFPVHNCDVADGVAYLTGNLDADTAMVAVDVATADTRELGRWRLTDEDDAWAAVHPFVRSIHDITVQGAVAAVAHWDAGTWLVDVSDPAAMTAITAVAPGDPAALQDADVRDAGFQRPGNAHYAALNDDATVLGVGEEAWDLDAADDVVGGPGGITLYDVSDPGDVTELARIPAPSTPDSGLGGVFTTSHNFDFHGDRLYTAWYRGGVKLFDVADPADPIELAWWREPNAASFWTAQYAPGPGCFVASSRRTPPAEDPEGAALYTFPDHAGVQADAPSLEPTTNPENGTTTATTRTATSTTPTTTTTTTTQSTVADTPGFGVVTGVAALGAAGAAWLRRRRGGD